MERAHMRSAKAISSVFRRSLMVAIPVATVVGLTALVYAGVTAFSPGDPLSSSAMNANFNSLQNQITNLQAKIDSAADAGTSTPEMPAGTIVAYGGIIDVTRTAPGIVPYLGNTGNAVGSLQASAFASHSHTATDSGHSHGSPNGGHYLLD